MKLLIRDDGTVFIYDDILAKEKDMRPASSAEVARYKKCLESGEKFEPDEYGEIPDEYVESDFALDLSSGDMVEAAPLIRDNPGFIVLTAMQVEKVLAFEKAHSVVENHGANEVDLDSMTVPALRSYAKNQFGIEMPNTTTKKDAIALIRQAQENCS